MSRRYILDEYKEDENFTIYLKKKITWDYFGQAMFKFKGIYFI